MRIIVELRFPRLLVPELFAADEPMIRHDKYSEFCYKIGSTMFIPRKSFLKGAPVAVAAAMMRSSLADALAKTESGARLGIPGPYRGRVVAVRHSGLIVSGAYQAEPIEQMMGKGMTELGRQLVSSGRSVSNQPWSRAARQVSALAVTQPHF